MVDDGCFGLVVKGVNVEASCNRVCRLDDFFFFCIYTHVGRK